MILRRKQLTNKKYRNSNIALSTCKQIPTLKKICFIALFNNKPLDTIDMLKI